MADPENDNTENTENEDPDDQKNADPLSDDGQNEGKPADDKSKDDKFGDSGRRALDQLRRENKATRRELAEKSAKLKEISDRDKSESERLAEAKQEADGRATKAETSLKKFQVAMDRAPEGATIAQVRAVAKRLHGDSEEELESDAEELFELIKAPAPESGKKSPAGKPRPHLRGGGDPEEEPEEMDPKKLAALIPRNR
jgi:predicted RNase H-like HicB family nuclease